MNKKTVYNIYYLVVVVLLIAWTQGTTINTKESVKAAII